MNMIQCYADYFLHYIMKKEKTPLAIIIATLSITANLVLGMMLLAKPKVPAISQLETAASDSSKTNFSDYPFLSKRIFAENQNDILINFIPLRQALREYAEKQENEIGVYFEYLPSGTSIGVNDQMQINIASLIKIPVVMAIYHEIDKGHIKKEDIITMEEYHIDKKFGDFWKKGVGTKITVMEAIELALIESDNTASTMLLSILPFGAIDTIFDALDIPKDTKNKLHIISPKNYSSILRSLYLSSSLEKKSSNDILEILMKSRFNDKIAAGLPETIKVSHKIGVFNSKDNPEETYSDCGIVYVPNRPYLLCVMTKSNEEKAREYMRHISKMIYGYITAVQ